jgi:hypothetical protein
MTAATSLGLAEGTPWRRGRNTQFNMKLSAYILVPFTTLGRRPRVARSIRSAAWAGDRRGRCVGLQPSLFTRPAVAEAELRAMEEILADVLDILAEVKANQDEMRQDHDARLGRVERLLTDQRRPWWQRLGNDNSIFGRARAPIQANLMLITTLISAYPVNADTHQG